MFVDDQGGYPRDSETDLKIFLGADHRGFELKNKVKEILSQQGFKVEDLGTFQPEPPCDYPRISYHLARRVAKTKNARGILVCMTGIGHSIAANKVLGAYAALCYNKEAALLSREHNNANILVVGAKFVSPTEMLEIIDVWLKTKFAGGRHLRRVKQIKEIEKKICG